MIVIRLTRAYYRQAVLVALAAGVIGLGLGLPTAPAQAQDANWIWTTQHAAGSVPTGAACYFRKSFTLRRPGEATLTIAADDYYEVYLNGHRIGTGRNSRHLDKYDLTNKLIRGRNTLAVKVVNETGSTAALAARLMVQDEGRWRSFSTDETWRTSVNPLPLWQTTLYTDTRWPTAQQLGDLGETAPWDRAENVAEESIDQGERFSIVEGFAVERVLGGEVTGSLIAMTFNEFGDLLVSREGGGLLRITDTDRDGIPDEVSMYCDQVKNCQGILALNGDVFVTADGPDGPALYRLQDKNRDGKLETIRALVAFEVASAEHGPHGIALGPDGLIYLVTGNHTKTKEDVAFSSPYRQAYEGDIVPRYEDPGGHAAGIKAPGGTVIRTDIEGSSVQIYAGGIRNAYDLAFNRNGDLFVHESDMESDLGMTWYRPTRVYHVTAGADLGWRSGWAKWPSYYLDACPPLVSTGRGSPTGAVVYEHVMFPRDYHGALFLGDWSEGRILAVRLERDGASYRASSEVFLQGQPLNVTDMDIGPDGALYFVTGGRGTRGSIYRVRWTRPVPETVRQIGSGITAVIRQHQPSAAWARQRVAKEKMSLGESWGRLVKGVATAGQNPSRYRTRALQLMQWYGPSPDNATLAELRGDSNEEVRAWAARLMGWNIDEANAVQLKELLADPDALVRRAACEALIHGNEPPSFSELEPLLKSADRHELLAARRLLERIPVDEWRDAVLSSDDLRVFLVGSLSLMIAAPDVDDAQRILSECQRRLQGFVSDRDFIDMLRVMEVAIERSGLQREQLANLGSTLAEEFPTGNAHLNRELMKLLAFLGADGFLDRALDYIESDVDIAERIHVAMLLRWIPNGWTPEKRMRVLKFFEEAQQHKGGGSHTLYLIHATRDFARQFDAETARQVILQGDVLPNAALGALYIIAQDIDPETRDALISLDRKLIDKNDDSTQRLRIGIVAVLTKSGDEAAQKYLREIWDKDPSRREVVALGLSRFPNEENWSYLVRSIPISKPDVLRELLSRLKEIPLAPEEPEYYRQVILAGLRLGDEGGQRAVDLLEYWTGEEPATGDSLTEQLSRWQHWYRETYPDDGDPVLPETATATKWKLDALLEYLDGDGRSEGDPAKGAVVFEKADCVKCHRFGNRGEPYGPDLTSVSKRFTKKEIVESILFPSHVISSQYTGKKLRLTDGRVLSGLVVPGGAGEVVVVQPDGSRLTLTKDEIEEEAVSKSSPMPEGLLEKLTLEEVNDLITYLTSPPATYVSRAKNGNGGGDE